ncbi:transcriptional regulator [Priestia veravalensis]|jgi:predicted site-specific integrase-resolvase|uniref:Transcriptional regulator n=1 Tax=Priestia veravalensis TaxID=1414648 RepID=A0A0V8JPR8_9BACI|nr:MULTISPECIES: helix-turn-helix domain-containing protein [Priestia]KSU88920.1 transcriptional regulator [Priestia veravalensis]SCC03047.1 Helix-turn-helix domain-containing protein [Priestia flexa]
MSDSFHIKTREQLVQFLASEVVTTSDAIEILGVSRQYVNKLVKNGTINPIRESSKEKLFLKSDILARKQKMEKSK